MFFTLLRFLPVCGNTSQVEYAYGDIYAKIEPIKLVSIISIDMVKRCITAGCSNTNADGVSLFHFPRHLSLRQKWNRQVQRTRADWKDATEYSVLCSKHFTNECFEEDSFIAAQFGMTKRKRLKPDTVPTIFHRPIAASESTSHDHLQQGPSVNPSVGHKRASLTEESLAGPQKKKKAAFEKRERARVCS